MRQRCSDRRAYTTLLRRVRARQTAYWANALDSARAQIEAEDRAYWGDQYDSLYPAPIADADKVAGRLVE